MENTGHPLPPTVRDGIEHLASKRTSQMIFDWTKRVSLIEHFFPEVLPNIDESNNKRI